MLEMLGDGVTKEELGAPEDQGEEDKGSQEVADRILCSHLFQ